MGSKERSPVQMNIKAKTIQSIVAASGGHLLAKTLDLAKNIILAWVLVPEDFGLVALALVLTESASQIGSGGIQEAVIQKNDTDERTVQIGFSLTLITSFLTLGIVWYAASLYGGMYNSQEINVLVKVLSICIIAKTVGFVPQTMLIRQLDFREKIVVELMAAVCGAIVAIGLAVWGFGYWSIVGGILGRALAVPGFLFFVRPSRVKLIIDLHVARRLLSFGFQVVLTSALALLVNRVPDAIIGGLLGTTALGYFVLALRWGNFAAFDMAQVLARVLYPAFCLVQNQSERLRRGYLKALRYLSFGIFPCSFGMAAIAPEFIAVVLGEKWNLSIVPLQLLCIAGLLRSLRLVGGEARRAVGRPEVTNYALAAQAVILGLLLLPMTYSMGLFGASAAVLLSSALATIGLLWVDGSLLAIKFGALWGVLKHPFVGSVIMVGLIGIERAILGNTNKAAALAVYVTTGVLSYSMYAFWTNPDLRDKPLRVHVKTVFGGSAGWQRELSR